MRERWWQNGFFTMACFTMRLVMVSSATLAAQPAPLTPFARQKAERLLHDKLACLGCHRIGGQGGMIAPNLDDVRLRRDPAYIAGIIADPTRVRPGAVMPKTRLSESERTLIIRYFGGDPTAVRSAPVLPQVVTNSSAPVLYQRWCAACHGATGNGDGSNAQYLPVAPARHADAAATSLRSDDALFDTIYGGGVIMNRSARMPAFGESLSDKEIRALVHHIRMLCRCEGPRWSRDGSH